MKYVSRPFSNKKSSENEGTSQNSKDSQNYDNSDIMPLSQNNVQKSVNFVDKKFAATRSTYPCKSNKFARNAVKKFVSGPNCPSLKCKFCGYMVSMNVGAYISNCRGNLRKHVSNVHDT